MKSPVGLGFISSLFFAVTFVLNRSMALEGGSWIWSSSLRFYWMLLFFLIIVLCRRNLKPLIDEIKENPLQWIIWSTVGFGFFYAPLTYAAASSPSWLVASTWQITIVAGILLAPFIHRNRTSQNTLKDFLFTGIILLGIVIMQIHQFHTSTSENLLKGFICIIVAAFAYPLGNRKMMAIVNGKLDVYQRILGMIICSMPFWITLNVFGLLREGSTPTTDQYISTLIIALFSGLIATALFFSATDKAKDNPQELAAVEATQSTQVVFALIGEVLLLKADLPELNGFLGIFLVITGMALHSFKKKVPSK